MVPSILTVYPTRTLEKNVDPVNRVSFHERVEVLFAVEVDVSVTSSFRV